jgi:hypothetical protein
MPCLGQPVLKKKQFSVMEILKYNLY